MASARERCGGGLTRRVVRPADRILSTTAEDVHSLEFIADNIPDGNEMLMTQTAPVLSAHPLAADVSRPPAATTSRRFAHPSTGLVFDTRFALPVGSGRS